MNRVLEQFEAVELSHLLHKGIPTWSGGCGFRLEVKMDYPEGLRVQSLKSHAGVGTHIDAPAHFVKEASCISDIPLDQLIVPLFVIDAREEMAPDFFLLPRHIEAFEKKHSPIQKKSLVLAHTGWGRFWNEPLRYRNPDVHGRMHFPGISEAAAHLLLERGIVGLGIDTLSPDGSINGAGIRYPVHELILGAGKYIIENAAHLEKMAPCGGYAIALPPRAFSATESAARLVGLSPVFNKSSF